MLESAIEPETASRPGIVNLIRRLKHETRAWVEAEVTLASIELGELRSRVLRLVISATIGFAAVFSALVVLTQAGVAVLAPLVGSVPLAALIVAAALVVLIAVCVWRIRSALSWQAESMFLRRIKRHPTSEGMG